MAAVSAPQAPPLLMRPLEMNTEAQGAPGGCGACACSALPGTAWGREACFSPLPLQQLLRDYAMGDVLGKGRFGTVWQCIHKRTNRQLACKKVRKVQGNDAYGAEMELQGLSRVQDHPHVLQLEGVFESNSHLFFVTEVCDAGDLLDLLSSEGPVSEEEAECLFSQLLHAVHHCHSRGVLHRDIKPENVLLQYCPTTGQKVVKLADFGLSTMLRTEGEKAMGWVGSEPYEAPEVLSLEPYDFSADIFSLGVVLFGLLSGTWPTFEFGRVFDAESNFSWPGWRSISQEAKALITQMLSEDPLSRPTPLEALSHPWLQPVSPLPPVHKPSPHSPTENEEQIQWDILDDILSDSTHGTHSTNGIHGTWFTSVDLSIRTPSSSDVPASVADVWEQLPLSRTLSASELHATQV